MRAQSTGRPWAGADRVFDLRVEDNPEPIAELKRLVRLQRAYTHANHGDELMTEKKVAEALKEYAAAEQIAPEIQVQDAQIITGRVANAQSEPISGIQFALTQSNTVTTQRTDAMTDAEGIFYAFMPTSASGVWSVAYTAVSCKSNTMDANCNCLGGVCGAPDPLSQTVSLPQKQALIFTWK